MIDSTNIYRNLASPMENFTVVLTSSVLAASLTSGVNWFLQRNNFKNDYYKKVIEYRIRAYDEVTELLNMLPFKHNLDWTDALDEYDEIGEKNYQIIIKKLETLINNNWMSCEITDLIKDFHKNIDSFYDDFARSPNKEVEKMVGYREETLLFKARALGVLYNDMEKLHDVAGFFKSKKVGT